MTPEPNGDTPAEEAWSEDFVVAAGAPCLDGHFPDAPTVPGAVLLGLAWQALAKRGRGIAAVPQMKFRRQLGPDQPFTLHVQPQGDGARLRWRHGSELVAEARVVLAPLDD